MENQERPKMCMYGPLVNGYSQRGPGPKSNTNNKNPPRSNSTSREAGHPSPQQSPSYNYQAAMLASSPSHSATPRVGINLHFSKCTALAMYTGPQ